MKVFANRGSDSVVDWYELSDQDCVFFTGADSTDSIAKPIIKPEAGYVWNEQLWVSSANYLDAVQVSNWKKPSAVLQSGLVFKAVFEHDLISAPNLSAYDDRGYSTWEKLCLAGTKISKFTSLIKAYITGKEEAFATPSPNWAYIDTAKIGNANPNALCGNESFVVVPFVPKAGENFVFTYAIAIPSDAEYGRDGKYDGEIAITFVHV